MSQDVIMPQDSFSGYCALLMDSRAAQKQSKAIGNKIGLPVSALLINFVYPSKESISELIRVMGEDEKERPEYHQRQLVDHLYKITNFPLFWAETNKNLFAPMNNDQTLMKRYKLTEKETERFKNLAGYYRQNSLEINVVDVLMKNESVERIWGEVGIVKKDYKGKEIIIDVFGELISHTK